MSILSKLEIEIHSPNQREIIEAGMFAAKNRCPAIIVMPDLVQGALIDRSTRDGKYMVIAAIDFPNGKEFALDKWRDLPQEVFDADGFEVVLSMRGDANSQNEIRAITELVKRYNPMSDIRFVLSYAKRPEKETFACCTEFKKAMPSLVRLEAPLVADISDTDIKAAISKIKEHAAVPIKVSGLPAKFEFQRCRQYLKLDGVSRVGVTFNQAKIIQAEELRDLQEQEQKPVPGKA